MRDQPAVFAEVMLGDPDVVVAHSVQELHLSKQVVVELGFRSVEVGQVGGVVVSGKSHRLAQRPDRGHRGRPFEHFGQALRLG